jgi:hypothetical protein
LDQQVAEQVLLPEHPRQQEPQLLEFQSQAFRHQPMLVDLPAPGQRPLVQQPLVQ